MKKKYKIAKNLHIIEKPRLAGNKRGWAIAEGNQLTIEILSSLSNAEKALTFQHELTHLGQYQAENKQSEKDLDETDEKVALNAERIFALAVVKYPPISLGIVELIHEKKGENAKTRVRSKGD